MRQQIQKFGRALSGMVMPNIGAFIAWGFVTALFIPSGWWPNTQMARLTGAMPKGTSGATATLRKQTTAHMPIVRAQDLGKGRGDEVTFHLLNPVGAKPIMGSKYAEGRGVGMKLSEDRLRVNQARKHPHGRGEDDNPILDPPLC